MTLNASSKRCAPLIFATADRSSTFKAPRAAKKSRGCRSSPESKPDDYCTPSFVCIEVNLQYKSASTSQFASYVRFPSPPRAIESAIERARPNARATALRFNSLKFTLLGKIHQTLKKPTPHAGLTEKSQSRTFRLMCFYIKICFKI
jgi:hypothetical protein